MIADDRFRSGKGMSKRMQNRRLHAQQRVRCHGRLAILTLSSFEWHPALFGRAGRFRFRQIIFPGTDKRKNR